MERVTGIGGYFMRAADPAALGAWYRDCLGLDADENGLWSPEAGPTVFAGFRAGRLQHLVTFQPVPEIGDAERIVFIGGAGEFVGEAVTSEPVDRAEWVPMGMVPNLIASGQLWNATSAAALLYAGDG